MTNTRTLNILAGLTWYIGAAVLLSKGTRLLFQAEEIDAERGWPWIALTAGVLFGAFKARYLLFKSCRKNLTRIAQLKHPRWWQFFRPQFFVALAVMIAVGVISSRLVEGHYQGLCVVGAVDVSVGTGLLLSGLAFLSTAPVPVTDSG